jgi:hypothetical protein
VTPTLSVDASQARSIVVPLWSGERRFWGWDGLCVSGAVVETFSTGLGLDSLPAASSAATWNA